MIEEPDSFIVKQTIKRSAIYRTTLNNNIFL